VKTKNIAPDLSEFEDFGAEILAYVQFARLKNLYRQGWLQSGVDEELCETVAEHSLGVVLLTVLYGMQKENEGFDLKKAMLMALFHDFGEIYAGDFTPSDQVSAEMKHNLERDAVERVFDGLAEKGYILSLWQEYESGSSIEAQFVKELDRLEMGLQAAVYKGSGILAQPEGFINTMKRDVQNPELSTAVRQIEDLCK